MMKGRMMGVIGVLLLLSAVVRGQTRPGRLSKEEQAALRPGLNLTFFAANDAAFAKPLDARTTRLAALYVPRGEAPSPFVAPGGFRATFEGYFKAPLKGDFRLHVRTSGEVEIELNGEAIAVKKDAMSVSLAKGFNKLRVRYTAPATGDAQVRLNWSGDDFIEEPLPPEALFTRGDEQALAAGLAHREGRELFASRHCIHCHTISADKLAMPELAADAPALAGVGTRLNDVWLRAWMLNPKSLRPTATMPKVLRGSDAEQAQQAADIAEYLMSLTDERLAAKAVDPTNDVVGEGLVLFENLGCIACHSTKPLDQEDPFARRSLHYAKAKFARGQLAAFLQAPQKHYAWSKMPDFRLSEAEATALAEFVQSRAPGVLALPKNPPSGDATRGKSLFTSAGCASCHRIGETPSKPEASARTPLTNPARGCLAEQRGKAPDFNFTAEQRSALLSFLTADRGSLARDTAAEFSLRQVKSLNCIACHRRDGNNSVLVNVLGDEGEQGQTPEILPLLTWTGEKLKPAWSEKLIAGQLDQRARPWLKARMPAWPARAKLLSIGLSHEHGFAVAEDERPKPDAALAKIGEQLVGDMNGFGCIKCHAIGKRPPLAPFEAPGINLASAAERLRYSYYPRWMLDPPRVDISTKMPKFAADGRTTAVTTIFDGQAMKQNEALWHYIQTLK